MENLHKEGFYYLEPGKSPIQLTKSQVALFKAIVGNGKPKKIKPMNQQTIELILQKDDEINQLKEKNNELVDRSVELLNHKIEIDRHIFELDLRLGQIKQLKFNFNN